jgi:lysophospholipase L1-like esterase
VRDTENISGQLETLLVQKGHQVEVLNAGCPGYSTWQVYQLLKERLLDAQPDWIVVGALWSDTQGADAPDSTRFGGQSMPWRYRSRAFILVQNWLNKRRWGVQEPIQPTNDPNRPKESSPENKSGGPEKVAFGLQPVLAPTNRVPLSDYKANLESIVELAAENDIQTAFLLLPGIRDLVDGRTGDFREGYREAMRAVAAEKKAPIADMPNQFIGGDSRHLFFDDVHPKTPGYTLIAEELGQKLTLQ